MTDITTIVLGVISILATVLTFFIVPYIKTKYGAEKIGEALKQTEQVVYWVKMFVSAAEQTFGKEQCEQKKKYVLDLITVKLQELNVTMDLEQIDAAIESAVLELHKNLAQ